jgi:hypothetical protein
MGSAIADVGEGTVESFSMRDYPKLRRDLPYTGNHRKLDLGCQSRVDAECAISPIVPRCLAHYH